MTIENCVIIGSGPAGHTAAVYAGRAMLEPLMYEGFMAGGVAAGGQLTTTTDVENYPGFPDGIGGPELMDLMRRQSERSGARIVTETVSAVDLSATPYRVTTDGGATVAARTVIIATGATAKRLYVPGAERLWQRGISACAVCDGALPVFRGKHLVVVGGGDTAAEEATFLTKYASRVTMLVRRDQMRASKAMQQRVFANETIDVSWNTVLSEVLGDDLVGGVRVTNVNSGADSELEAGGLFFAIGHEPNTSFLAGQLETDESGYLITPGNSTATSRPGVFACGDVQDKIYRQAVTAAGSGCMAAMEAERYLSEHAA
ncbi:MAG: thioredoxin-disulfide reductase [Spirochaetaceae bacterium]|nr:thioredoxin-disulfide reductase [Spirochaetaceae bacterium]